MAPSGPVPQPKSRQPLLTRPSSRWGVTCCRSDKMMTLAVTMAMPPKKNAAPITIGLAVTPGTRPAGLRRGRRAQRAGATEPSLDPLGDERADQAARTVVSSSPKAGAEHRRRRSSRWIYASSRSSTSTSRPDHERLDQPALGGIVVPHRLAD